MSSGPDRVSKDKNEGLHAPTPPQTMQDRKEDWIGRQLRRVFNDALSEPLPDDIMSLLENIDSKPKAKPVADGDPK